MSHQTGGDAIHSEAEGLFQTFRAPALQKQWSFIERARSHGLYFQWMPQARLCDHVGPPLSARLAEHMRESRLSFVEMSILGPPPGLNNVLWTTLIARNVSRTSTRTAILHVGLDDMTTDRLTFSRLMSSINRYSNSSINLVIIGKYLFT